MCPPPCSCATEMKRMPASGKRSSASMYADPTIPNTSFTPCATSVSTNASDGVIVWRPDTAIFFCSDIVFIASPHHACRRDVRIPERLRDRLAGHLAERDIEAVLEMGVVGERLLPALVGER